MPGLKESSPDQIAKRMRDIAAGLTNPADKEAAKAYADEVKQAAQNERQSFMASDKRD